LARDLLGKRLAEKQAAGRRYEEREVRCLHAKRDRRRFYNKRKASSIVEGENSRKSQPYNRKDQKGEI